MQDVVFTCHRALPPHALVDHAQDDEGDGDMVAEETPKKGSLLKTVLAEAKRTKTKWLAVSSKAHSILDAIKTDPKWHWADNKQNHDELKASLQSIEGSLNQFHKNHD